MKKSKTIEGNVFTIIPNKLYFLSSINIPDAQDAFYFNIDDELFYEPINQEMGPLKISYIFNFVKQLSQLLENPKRQNLPIYFHTGRNLKQYTNAVLLICAYQVLHLKYSPEKAYSIFKEYNIPAFRDINGKKSDLQCTILDCLKALETAIKIQWFSMQTFNIQSFDLYAQKQYGYITEIIPKKLLVFKTPTSNGQDQYGNRQKKFSDYIPILNDFEVTTIIDLVEKPAPNKYIQELSESNGIKYNYLYFKAEKPPVSIVDDFLGIIEKVPENQKITVICQDGLSKSCTLVGCYCIKHYHLTAKQYIGWARLCRSGALLNSQQFFLMYFQQQLMKQGQNSPIRQKVKKLKQLFLEELLEEEAKRKKKEKRSQSIKKLRVKKSSSIVVQKSKIDPLWGDPILFSPFRK